MSKHRARTGRKQAVRLRDVAKFAGVSTASVSRVLNEPELVSAELRHRIQGAIEELGYVPNWTARALSLQKSRTIGAVVPTLDIAIFANGVEALQTRLHASGHSLLLASSQYDIDEEVAMVATLLERRVDGLVLVGNEHAPAIDTLISKAEVPVVTTYQHDPTSRYPSVGVDNRAASGRIIEYLLQLGHVSFGLVTSPTAHNDRIRARVEGMKTCLHENGICIDDARIVEVPYSIRDGRFAMRNLLARFPDITAVACTADVLAIGAIFEAQKASVRVPGDVSVAGFDDLELASQMEPSLTTIHVPADEIGRRTADLILAAIAGKLIPHNVELPAELILRGSTGRIN